MPTQETVRRFASTLLDVTEQRSRSDSAAELVTNKGRCFASLPDDDPGGAHVSTTEEAVAELLAAPAITSSRPADRRGSWVRVDLGAVSDDDVERLVLGAWRLRARKTVQGVYLGPRFVEDIAPILTALRSWPELTEPVFARFALGDREFLHFHCWWTGRRADVRIGRPWGPPIAIPLGTPSPAFVEEFLAEVRRRLELTV